MWFKGLQVVSTPQNERWGKMTERIDALNGDMTRLKNAASKAMFRFTGLSNT
jgi:hypothetical protein